MPANPVGGTLYEGAGATLPVEVYLPGSVDPGTSRLIGRVGAVGVAVADEDAFGIRVR